jgi:hypothetical protein
LDRHDDGENSRHQCKFCPTHLARAWSPAAPGPAVKLSNGPKFVDKLRDVVGLYVDPPAHAIVLSVDEKSPIQALDRTQPGLPMKKGRAGTMTHDYKRHGLRDATGGAAQGETVICSPAPVASQEVHLDAQIL